jgi:hypothetical protein
VLPPAGSFALGDDGWLCGRRGARLGPEADVTRRVRLEGRQSRAFTISYRELVAGERVEPLDEGIARLRYMRAWASQTSAD